MGEVDQLALEVVIHILEQLLFLCFLFLYCAFSTV